MKSLSVLFSKKENLNPTVQITGYYWLSLVFWCTVSKIFLFFLFFAFSGSYPKWLHRWGLSIKHQTSPASTLASSFPFSSPHHLWASLGWDAILGGPSKPPWLRPGFSLHAWWRVLLTAAPEWGGEDGGLVPKRGARGWGERTARRE